jgi:repressor LexA
MPGSRAKRTGHLDLSFWEGIKANLFLVCHTFVWYTRKRIFFLRSIQMAPATPVGQTRELIFNYVRERIFQGNPPTVREVQHEFGFKAVQTAREHLEKLILEGRLTKHSGVSRGFRLPEKTESEPSLMIPLLGFVQAGLLTEAIENPEGYIPISTTSCHQKLFALKVKGLSMKNAGILPGDIVIVRQQVTAQKGDIVVAMIEDEATVKKLGFINSKPCLFPENDDFEPLVPMEGQELLLLGKVIEIRRKLE